MFGASSILDMGRWALFAAQAQLQVTGENIANVNTPGYSRRSVLLEEGIAIDYRPGQMGTGVKAVEVLRHFDSWIEEQYLDQASVSARWESLYNNLRSVESLVNESQGYGLSEGLSEYFQAWNDLTQRPEDYGSRTAVVDSAVTLASNLTNIDGNLALMQERVDDLILQEVENANTLMVKIADLNKQITIHQVDGANNANTLLDERATMIRELGEIIDINVIDKGSGELTITTKSGQTLVDRDQHFSLNFDSPRTLKELELNSTFDGEIYYSGTDNYEYTIDVVQGGYVSDASGPNTAMFRVSMDGGKTWLRDEDGNDKLFYARDEDSMVQAEDLGIYFGTAADSRVAPATQLTAGDRFLIVPQKGLYWVENTSHQEMITPQVDFNGVANSSRCTEGTLAAYFNFRDHFVGAYRDKLDTFAEGLIWEVNRRHSQGAGLEMFDSVQGTYSVDASDRALGSASSGLHWFDKLQSGSSMFYVYDNSTGLLVSGAALDFDGVPGGAQGNFDPNLHSLEDVRDAVNNSFGTYVTASIVNNKLVVDANDGYQFGLGTDSTGLWAGLGINTFFNGTGASDMSINSTISQNLDYLAAGHINGAGEYNEGNNVTALSIADLEDVNVLMYTVQEGYSEQTLLDYYNGIVGNVGSDTAASEFSYEYTKALANDLNERQQELAGVNLDEEMANLIRFQHSYTAAAKLITTADQMLQTVLSLKS